MKHERANMRAFKMHMDGLKQIVNVRGDLNAARSTNPIMANFVFRHVAAFKKGYRNRVTQSKESESILLPDHEL